MRKFYENLIRDLTIAIQELESEAEGYKEEAEWYAIEADGKAAELGDVLNETHYLITEGFVEEAGLRLGRYLHPKWHSVVDCQEAYDKEMGR